jgi:hypothetical protein
MSQVRFARPEDIPALVDLGRQMHVQSRYTWMQFNAKRLWTCLEAAIANKQHCVIVATDDGVESDASTANLSGVLWACAFGLPFSSEFVAQIDYLYVIPKRRGTPAAMKMMAGLRRWANNRQIAEILLPNAFGADEVYSTKLLGKMGLKAVGGVHSMWVDRH